MNDPASARWMQLEIYGHRKLVGQVSETTLAGESMLKIVVPPTKACPEGFEYMFGGKAVFGACTLDEKTARQIAEQIAATPPRPWLRANMLGSLDDEYEQPMLPPDGEVEAELEPLGVVDDRIHTACWICGGTPVKMNMSMVCAAHGPYCDACIAASREPIGLLVGSLTAVAREDIDPGMRIIIAATIDFYRHTEAEFWALVDKARAAYEATHPEPDARAPDDGSTDIPF